MQRTLPLSSSPWTPLDAQHRLGAVLARSWPAAAVLAGGLALRSLLLAQPGLHPDEALYASWALRIAAGSDPALLGVYVDKPPWLLYLLGGLFRLAGFDGVTPLDTDWLVMVGRLAAVAASGVSLALLWLVALRVYRPAIALGATALFAVSPLAVRLAPTLFTDPWLTLWLLLGLWAALARRGWLAGIACGLAYATKQQAVLFLPLILAVIVLAPRRTAAPASAALTSQRRLLWRWLNGFALVAVLVLWWDSLRWQWMPSYWDRSAQTYGGVALALDADLAQRLLQWGELLGYAFGWPLLLALGALVAGAVISRRPRGRASRARPGWFDTLLLAFTGVYLLVHLGTNLAPWDRYLLPVVPLLALLLARGAAWAWELLFDSAPDVGRGRWGRSAAVVAVLVGSLYAGAVAGFARLPLGDGGIYDGVAAVAAHVRMAEPPGAVLYHHWLGWHYGFYLYGAPVELRWWQSPVDLASLAVSSAGQRQLIAFPAGRQQAGVRAALGEAGLALTPLMASTDAQGGPSVLLYSIVLRPAGAASHGR